METVPVGGRRLRHAALAGRKLVLDERRGVSRKELAAAARDAEKAFDLRPALRLVLGELVGCYGEREIDGRLMVWPSNDYLVERSGLSERAIRHAVRDLVDLQLVTPKDSANGKRFAIRNKEGDVVDAYGFDLTPLYARRAEFAGLVLRKRQLEEIRSRQFDEITIARRATEEALYALEVHFPKIDRSEFEEELERLRASVPRRSSAAPIEGLASLFTSLREKVEETFYQAGNAGSSCRHKEDNNDSPSETCTKAFQGKAEPPAPEPDHLHRVPLGLVVEACPALADYGRDVRSEADLVAAARFLRSSIGANEDAWREAQERLGLFRASAALVFVLQLHTDDVAAGRNHIKNPGGYFRALVRMIDEGKFSLVAELGALRRRHTL